MAMGKDSALSKWMLKSGKKVFDGMKKGGKTVPPAKKLSNDVGESALKAVSAGDKKMEMSHGAKKDEVAATSIAGKSGYSSKELGSQEKEFEADMVPKKKKKYDYLGSDYC